MSAHLHEEISHLHDCITRLEVENERPRLALAESGTRMKNARGAVESNQVIDKDVHGTLTRGIADVRAALEASR